jgi:hypothetical protein
MPGPHALYRSLLRRIAAGEDIESEVLEPILCTLGRTPQELEADLRAIRQRRHLAKCASELTDLTERLAIADEGYRLVRESAQEARDKAKSRERRARRALSHLQRRLRQARQAEDELKQLLPSPAVKAWEAAEKGLAEARTALRRGHRECRNTEYLEADVETAERFYDEARRAALEA